MVEVRRVSGVYKSYKILQMITLASLSRNYEESSINPKQCAIFRHIIYVMRKNASFESDGKPVSKLALVQENGFLSYVEFG